MSNTSKVYPIEHSSHIDVPAEECAPESEERYARLKEWSHAKLSKFRAVSAENRCTIALILFAAIISIIAICIVIIALIAGCYTTGTQIVQPIFVYMIWRHGDRSPNRWIDKLSYNKKYFPDEKGSLTELGYAQAIELGKRIRKRYFEHSNFTAEQVFIRSTNMSRTIRTAEGVLHSLGMPNAKITVEADMDNDTVGNPLFECPAANRMVEEWGDRYLMKEHFNYTYGRLERELNFTGYTYPLLDLIDCLNAHDLMVPEWAKNNTLISILRSLSWMGIKMQYGIEPFANELLKKIRTGNIVRSVVEEMSAVILNRLNSTEWIINNTNNNNNNIHKNIFNNININNDFDDNYGDNNNNNNTMDIVNPEDLYFYGLSAHDITIAAVLMNTMKNLSEILGPSHQIGYAANIAFELYDIKGKFKLKVLYARRYDLEPEDITHKVAGCEGNTKKGTLCDVERFFEATENSYFENVQQHCVITEKKSNKKPRRGPRPSKKVKRSVTYFNGDLSEVFME